MSYSFHKILAVLMLARTYTVGPRKICSISCRKSYVVYSNEHHQSHEMALALKNKCWLG